MSELVLTPLPIRLDGDTLRQSARIRRPGRVHEDDVILWWDAPSTLAPLPEGDAESYLITALFAAMAEGLDVRIEGSVGQCLLANLEEFMIAWSLWKPAIYRRIRIVPDEIRTEVPRPWSRTAVAAFSGGVDASYSVWRHHSKKAGYASREVVACALIHGFDIPLDQEEKFAASVRLARESLGSLGIELVPLRSNLRQILPLDWHDLHGAAVVGAMQLLKSKAPTLLIGSTDPYYKLLFPYGSNPITDRFLSTGSMEVVHDGCGADRTGKVSEIGNWATGFSNLRVCWKGAQIEANCGRCEKCLRTQLNCLANGLPLPGSLPLHGLSPNLIILDSDSEHILQEYDQILDAAHRNGIDSAWVSGLEHRLKTLRFRNVLLRGVKAIKNLLRPGLRLARRLRHLRFDTRQATERSES